MSTKIVPVLKFNNFIYRYYCVSQIALTYVIRTFQKLWAQSAVR